MARGAPAADGHRAPGPRLRALDERLLVLARTRGHTPGGERAAARFSRLGEHGALWLAIGLAGRLLDRRRAPGWRAATRSVAAAYALNTAIKPLVGRRRPEIAGLPPLTSTPTGLSFPSAHAATSFAGALAYSRLGLPRAPLYALATALSFSRVYLGVHHPSDVLAGAALGTAVGACASRSGSGMVRPHGEPGAGSESR
ncbi:MAG: phosphatase PAP2 family protein [Actinobacteria bacterium]|nr:MAG: phosphatase PAP2 family protein [Actinomycetota bacterium]